MVMSADTTGAIALPPYGYGYAPAYGYGYPAPYYAPRFEWGYGHHWDHRGFDHHPWGR